MTVKKNIDADESRKDTLPPPPSGDAYSAETIVRDVPPQVLEAIKARRHAEELAMAAARARDAVKTPVADLAPALVPPPEPEPAPVERVEDNAAAATPSVVFEKDDEEERASTLQRPLEPEWLPLPAPRSEIPPDDTWRWLVLAIAMLAVAVALALYIVQAH